MSGPSIRNCDDAVDVITISEPAIVVASASNATTSAPMSAASSRARSSFRFVTCTFATPLSARLRAVSFPASPALTTSTVFVERSPKIDRASETAVELTETA